MPPADPRVKHRDNHDDECAICYQPMAGYVLITTDLHMWQIRMCEYHVHQFDANDWHVRLSTGYLGTRVPMRNIEKAQLRTLPELWDDAPHGPC